MAINIFESSFINSRFPGSKGVPSAEIDQFVNLLDSTSINNSADDQIAWAQYYNKLVNSVRALQQYVIFEPSEATGVGECGLPTYSVSCISGVGTGRVGVLTDLSVDSLTQTYTKTIRLDYIYHWYSTRLSSSYRQKPTGSVIPFEIVFTSDESINYSKTTYPGLRLVQSQTLWDSYVGSGNPQVSLSLAPLRSLGNPSTQSLATTGNPYSTYNGPGWLHSLRLTYYTIKTSDHLLIRGCIYDYGKADDPTIGTGSDIAWAESTWLKYGQRAELVVSLMKVSS